MTEHVHEWLLEMENVAIDPIKGACCKHCSEKLDIADIVRRLNATERLSRHIAKEQVRLLEIFAENPDSFPYPSWFRVEAFALQAPMFAAYAAALEGE